MGFLVSKNVTLNARNQIPAILLQISRTKRLQFLKGENYYLMAKNFKIRKYKKKSYLRVYIFLSDHVLYSGVLLNWNFGV